MGWKKICLSLWSPPPQIFVLVFTKTLKTKKWKYVDNLSFLNDDFCNCFISQFNFYYLIWNNEIQRRLMSSVADEILEKKIKKIHLDYPHSCLSLLFSKILPLFSSSQFCSCLQFSGQLASLSLLSSAFQLCSVVAKPFSAILPSKLFWLLSKVWYFMAENFCSNFAQHFAPLLLLNINKDHLVLLFWRELFILKLPRLPQMKVGQKVFLWPSKNMSIFKTLAR